MESWFADSKPSSTYPVYTRANAGEVLPDPMSPLTASLGIMRGGELGWRDAYVRLGTLDYEEFEDDRPNCIACFGGYLYLNMSCTRIYGVRCPGLTPEMVDFQYFGAMPGIPPYEEERRPTDEDPRHSELLGRFLNEYCFGRADLPELREDRDVVDQFVAERPDLSDLSPAELVARARATMPLYRKLFDQHIGVSASSGVGIGTVAQVCTAIGRPELTMSLIAGVGDVDSAAPSWALWDLSRMVTLSPFLTAAFDAGVDGLLKRVHAATAASSEPSTDAADAAKFLEAFGLFLDRFGSRGPNEWEYRSQVWAIRPELPLAAIERMRLAGPEASPQRNAEQSKAERERATDEVRAALAGQEETLAKFEAGLRCALLFSAGRERSKTSNIRIVHEGRLALRELGRRLAEEGAIDRADLVFMLSEPELDRFVDEPTLFAQTLREREEEYLSLFALEPPFIVYRQPPPLTSWPRKGSSDVALVDHGTVLEGIPGCAGRATGRARVILDPSDPTLLEPGDILVAPVTDPAWTPLFVPAAAVVVDVGAQITHAVIVSRELGIPCVVSVTDATRKIPDGAIVTVDGALGTVTIH
jgi:pyruvate,water dikinase